MSETAKNLSEIVTKLKEIDSVFKFGEKMIPVIEGFVSFISDFIPFVEQVSGSISDTRSKIPEASNQIDKVTNATELATTEALDKIDLINTQLGELSEGIDEMIQHRIQAEMFGVELRKEIESNKKATEILQKMLKSLDVGLTLEMMKNQIREITSNTDLITMSLQVQDITAQQLAAVNHLIISVQHKLGGLLDVVDSTGYSTAENIKMEKLPDVHFDANASYNPGSNHQGEVDSIIHSEKASQEEIDKLFS